MSTKQSYIDRINKNIAEAEKLKVDTFIDEAKNKNSEKRKKDIDTYSAGMDAQIDNTKKNYEKEVDSANASYANEYERNAVQKLINERQVAEVNANLGISNSGRNATQQTAVQLSYANQKGRIDLARKNTLDNLNFALTNAITVLQNEKTSGIRDIENQWDNLSVEQGTNAYNNKLSYYNSMIDSDNKTLAQIEEAEIEANNKIEENKQDIAYKQWEKEQELKYKQWEKEQNIAYKQWEAQQDAQTKIEKDQEATSYGAGGTSKNDYILKTNGGLLSRDYYGSLKDNGIDTVYNYDKKGKVLSVTYTDNNSGKRTTIAYGKNPYTGDDNILGNSDAAKAVRLYGTYDNGYQPKGVYKKGVDYGAMIRAVGKTNPEATYGLSFNIFETNKNGTHYWVWDATINNYVEVVQKTSKSGQKEWVWKG